MLCKLLVSFAILRFQDILEGTSTRNLDVGNKTDMLFHVLSPSLSEALASRLWSFLNLYCFG